jgi:sulfite reductase (NADPH) flavoprotein alpha-component
VRAPGGRRTTARDALILDCCITQSNDRALDLLAKTARDPGEAQRLVTLLEEDADHFLDGKDVLDLLEHFPSARPSIGELIATLPILQPRLYSISSSPAAYPDEVHLTVGVVRYLKDGCDRPRKGVASTFLAERVQAGQKARIFVQQSHGFHLPQHGDVPIIMVGPGTGIAPFRAFLQERRALRATGPSWLFFGDQRRECDFLYRDELESYMSTGTLTYLDTAFSRDQDEKIYVQHRMLAHAARIWEWLERGAHVYVCGDARRMARDVDATLRQIVAEQGRRTEVEAKAYVTSLARAKRYLRDVY